MGREGSRKEKDLALTGLAELALLVEVLGRVLGRRKELAELLRQSGELLLSEEGTIGGRGLLGGG